MTALVTGATGLLGGSLVRALAAQGEEVRVVARDVTRASEVLGDLPRADQAALRIVPGDLGEISSFSEHLSGVDVVYGCAAYFREYYQPGDHDDALRRLNVGAVTELAQAADRHGVPTFVHVSSIGVTGPAARAGDASDETCAPTKQALSNGYHASKWASEHAVEQLRGAVGVRIPIVRPGWLFGPHDTGPTTSGQLFLDVARGALPATWRTARITWPRRGNRWRSSSRRSPRPPGCARRACASAPGRATCSARSRS